MNQKTDDPTDTNEPADPATEEAGGAKAGDSPGSSFPDDQDVPAERAADPESEHSEAHIGEPAAAEKAADAGYGAAPPVRRTSAGTGWLAVLLALAALAGVGWLAWQDRTSGGESEANAERLERLSSQFAGFADELEETTGGLQELRGSLGQFEDERTELAAEIESLRERIDDLLERSETLAPRLADLENAVSSLQGISTGAREAWMLAEAEYYMQIANARLQLARNPEIALLALNYADERIRQLADPGLTEVRRALSGEIQALEAHERLDVEGIALALANLADRVDSLPLDERMADSPDRPVAPADEEEPGGVSRAWRSVKRAFSGLVSVRRADEDVRPLLSPEAAWFLRANLALQFDSARLALLRGEQTVYRQSLADAADWLGRYYDADSRAVRQAIETIGEVRARDVEVALPDISESLRLLRQYRARTDLQAGARTAGEPAR